MNVGGKEASQIVVTGADGEVLVVISDNEIIEKNGVGVIVDWI